VLRHGVVWTILRVPLSSFYIFIDFDAASAVFAIYIPPSAQFTGLFMFSSSLTLLDDGRTTDGEPQYV
jgi:hypothetical protein